jgi:hypothetical protein
MTIHVHQGNDGNDEMAKAMALMTPAEKREFYDKLNNALVAEISASEAHDKKRVRMESVRAARAKAMTDLAASNEMAFLDGMLRRYGLPIVEEFAARGPDAIDKLMASASRPLTTELRLELKCRLHKLRLA